MKEKLIKSKERVKKFAEVYTPEFLVNDMINLIPEDMYKNPLTKFLEPTCGNGNFLVGIINKKMSFYDNKDN